jgi:hypothetical protein
MADTLRAGLVGMGGIANLHATGWGIAPNAELVAGSDVNTAVFSRWEKEYGLEYTTADPDEIFNDPDIDIVDICAPNNYHAEQMLNGLMLKELGYGKNASRLRSDTIAAFLYRLPDYAEHLQAYDRQGNQAITGKLDELLADDCRLLKRFHK